MAKFKFKKRERQVLPIIPHFINVTYVDGLAYVPLVTEYAIFRYDYEDKVWNRIGDIEEEIFLKDIKPRADEDPRNEDV